MNVGDLVVGDKGKHSDVGTNGVWQPKATNVIRPSQALDSSLGPY